MAQQAPTYHRRLMANLINVERATVGYGTRTLLDAVSLGVDEGDAIGVVGRNGDGKTTLLQVLTGTREPDSGRVTHTSGLSVGYLRQTDDFAAGSTVREVIDVGGRPDHIWAAEPDTRTVVEHLLAEVTSTATSPTSAAVNGAGWRWPACCWSGMTCWCSTSPPTISTSRATPTVEGRQATEHGNVLLPMFSEELLRPRPKLDQTARRA